jgi:hypothetical protein
VAIFAQRALWTLRPGGVKVRAGAPAIECEMVEDDFRELAAAGVKLLGEDRRALTGATRRGKFGENVTDR